jgi:Glycosyltransferase family 87
MNSVPMSDLRPCKADKHSGRTRFCPRGRLMENDSSRGARAFRVDSPVAPRPAWKLDGLGMRSLCQARPWVLAVILIVGFTIWGYASIGPSGRLEAGHIDQHRTDFTVFTEAGAAFFDGRNPYGVTNPRGWHYLYPPLFALLVAPLSLFDTESQVVSWYAVNVVLTFGCFGETRRLWRTIAGPSDQRRLIWVGGCGALAMVLPFLDCMQAGQLGIAILYFLMLGFRLVLEGRTWPIWFAGGLTLALPASVKLVPSLPVVFLLLEQWAAVVFAGRRVRPWGRAIGSTAGVSAGALLFLLLIPASIIGWQKNLHSLDVWQKQVVMNERVGPTASFNVHSYRNQSLANAVYLWCKPPVSASKAGAGADRPERIANPGVRVVIGFVLIVLLGVAAILGRRGAGLDACTAFGLACCATLLVSPIAWGHYFMVELPVLLSVPLWLWRRGRLRMAKVVAVVPAVLSWAYYLRMAQLGGAGILGLGTAGWFLVACGLIFWLEAVGVKELSVDATVDEQAVGMLQRPRGIMLGLARQYPGGRVQGGRRRRVWQTYRGR